MISLHSLFEHEDYSKYLKSDDVKLAIGIGLKRQKEN